MLHSEHWWSWISTRKVYSSLKRIMDNRRWSCTLSSQGWSAFWKGLWNGKAHPQTNVYVRILKQNGYFTNTRRVLWGISSEICPMCGSLPKTTAHPFFECNADKQGGSRRSDFFKHLRCPLAGWIQAIWHSVICCWHASEEPCSTGYSSRVWAGCFFGLVIE
jgi:hypothetical protein